MKPIFSLLSIFSFLVLFAQEAPEIEWSKTFGGSLAEEGARSILETSDGGFIVVGPSGSDDGDLSENKGSLDYWIVKFDATGNIQWEKSYGGSGQDWPNSIKKTNDGGYVIAGFSDSNDFDVTSNHGNTDAWIVKIGEQGNLQWQKSYGTSENDAAISIVQTQENAYVFSGYTQSEDGNQDFYIVKLNDSGEIIWEKSYGGTFNEVARDLKQTTDGGFILTGNSDSSDGDITNNYGKRDVWVVKLDPFGNLDWQKTYGGSQNDRGDYISETVKGGFIFIGSTNSNDYDVTENHGMSDYWVVEIDNIGEIKWQKTFGGSGNDLGSTMTLTNDGGYILLGETTSNDGDVTKNNGGLDYWVVKINSTGVLLWENSLGGAQNDDWALSVIQTSDNGFLIAGRSKSNDGDVTDNHGSSDFWIVKLAPDQMSTSETYSNQISIYPNPAKDILHFSEELKNIEIHSLTGLKMAQKKAGSSIQISQFISGIYVLTAETKNGQNVNLKFIKD